MSTEKRFQKNMQFTAAEMQRYLDSLQAPFKAASGKTSVSETKKKEEKPTPAASSSSSAVPAQQDAAADSASAAAPAETATTAKKAAKAKKPAPAATGKEADANESHKTWLAEADPKKKVIGEPFVLLKFDAEKHKQKDSAEFEITVYRVVTESGIILYVFDKQKAIWHFVHPKMTLDDIGPFNGGLPCNISHVWLPNAKHPVMSGVFVSEVYTYLTSTQKAKACDGFHSANWISKAAMLLADFAHAVAPLPSNGSCYTGAEKHQWEKLLAAAANRPNKLKPRPPPAKKAPNSKDGEDEDGDDAAAANDKAEEVSTTPVAAAAAPAEPEARPPPPASSSSAAAPATPAAPASPAPMPNGTGSKKRGRRLQRNTDKTDSDDEPTDVTTLDAPTQPQSTTAEEKAIPASANDSQPTQDLTGETPSPKKKARTTVDVASSPVATQSPPHPPSAAEITPATVDIATADVEFNLNY